MWKFQGVWALGLMSPMQSISRKHVGIKRHSSHKLIIEKQAKNCLISTYWIIFNNFISTVDKNTLLYLNISTLRGRRQQPFSPLLPQTEKKKWIFRVLRTWMDALGPHRDLDPPASCAAACMKLFVSFKQNVSRIEIKQSIKITLICYSVQCKLLQG